MKKKRTGINNIIINNNININNNYKDRIYQNININQIDKNNNLLNKENTINKNNSKIFSPLIPEKQENNKKDERKNSSKIIIFNKKNKPKDNIITYSYKDFELNSLSYKKALIYDKRTYFQYYCSLLKQKHLILFTFISKNDYNLFIIKLSLFIFSFSLYFTVNAVFFDDNIIHIIYETHGKLGYIYYMLNNIIYSTIISSFTTVILKLLAFSNKKISKLKEIKIRKKALKKSINIVNGVNLKFQIYFIVSIIILIFFWYYISAFCAVYNNSQLFLIQNTLSSFGMSLIYPFGLYLIPGIFRILSLKSKNKKCMYSFGKFISTI